MDARIAVDLGATSGRVMWGAIRAGRVELHESLRFGNEPVSGAFGLEWNLEQLLSSTAAGIRRAVEQADAAGADVRSIGIDSWGVDFSLLKKGVDPTPPRSYLGITAEQYERVPTEIRHANFRSTGIAPMPINSLYQLLDLAGRYRAGDELLLIPDLWVHWLTGVAAAERTIASTTEMLDAFQLAWSSSVLDRFGLSRDCLPELVGTGASAGEVLPKGREVLGLGEHDIEVIRVAEHDTASAVLAVPATGENFAFISSGSWSLVGVELARPILSDRAREAGVTNEAGAFGNYLFMKNLAGLSILESCLREWAVGGRSLSLARLIDAATIPPAARMLIDVGDPAFVSAGDTVQRIRAYCAATSQPVPRTAAETARTIFDSLATAYRIALREIQQLSGKPVDVVHIIGGGSRNTLLCQLCADATGLTVIAGPSEATSLGNILAQAIAQGTVSGTAEARRIAEASSVTHRYLPAAGNSWSVDWDAAEQRMLDLIRSKETIR